MILWKPHVSKDFCNGYRLENAGVGKGGNMHEDLGKLIEFLKRDGREWSIAKIECNEEEIELELTLLQLREKCLNMICLKVSLC